KALPVGGHCISHNGIDDASLEQRLGKANLELSAHLQLYRPQSSIRRQIEQLLPVAAPFWFCATAPRNLPFLPRGRNRLPKYLLFSRFVRIVGDPFPVR